MRQSSVMKYKTKDISETAFKLRYADHTKSFNTEKYKNETELSKEVWKIKEANLTPTDKWKIVKQCKSYNPATRNRMLCLYEKYEIIMYKHGNLLNKKTKWFPNAGINQENDLLQI